MIEASGLDSSPILIPAPFAAARDALSEPEAITRVASAILTSVASTDTVEPCTKRSPATVRSPESEADTAVRSPARVTSSGSPIVTVASVLETSTSFAVPLRV